MSGLPAELYAFVSVVIIDLVLAGDNAVVVGIAASGLPREKRRRVIVLGIVLAPVCRIAFALVAVQLLVIIGLLLAGGLLLLWVAWKMWRELHPRAALHLSAYEPQATPVVAKRPATAIVQIAIADVSMSVDNVLAVAGAAREHLASCAGLASRSRSRCGRRGIVHRGRSAALPMDRPRYHPPRRAQDDLGVWEGSVTVHETIAPDGPASQALPRSDALARLEPADGSTGAAVLQAPPRQLHSAL